MYLNTNYPGGEARKRKRPSGDALKVKEYDPSGSVYSSRVSDEEWEEHRAFITESHEAGRSRVEIQGHLIEVGLVVSLPQLYARMRKWGLKVYNDRQKDNQPTASSSIAGPSNETDSMLDAPAPTSSATGLETDNIVTVASIADENLSLLMDLPLFDVEAIQNYASAGFNGPGNASTPPASLQSYIKAMQDSGIATTMQGTIDWENAIIHEVNNNPTLTYHSRHWIYSILTDLFSFYEWSQASLLMSFEKYGCAKALMFENTDEIYEQVCRYYCFLEAFITCCCYVWSPGSREEKVLKVLHSDFVEIIHNINDSSYMDGNLGQLFKDEIFEAHFFLDIATFRAGLSTISIEEYSKKLKVYDKLKQSSSLKPRSLGKIGAYVREYLHRTLRRKINSTTSAIIHEKWAQDAHMVSDLFTWCRCFLQARCDDCSPLPHQDDFQHTEEQDPVCTSVLTIFLLQWFNNNYGRDGTHLSDTKQQIRGFERFDCLHCINRLVRCLAKISLLTVSNAWSVPLVQAKRQSGVPLNRPIHEVILGAIDNLRTMRSAELRLIYFESGKVIFGDKIDQTQLGTSIDDEHKSDEDAKSIGLFALAFTRYLSNLCQTTNHSSFFPCAQGSSPVERSPKVEVKPSPETASVYSDESFDARSMRRLRQRARQFFNKPSTESLVSLILGDRSPGICRTPRLLSSAMSLLSLGSTKSVSTINTTSTMRTTDSKMSVDSP